MNESANVQAQRQRVLVQSLEREFARLHVRSCQLIAQTSADILYANPSDKPGADESNSVGENILRSAGAVEQTSGGLTANLWDDPFEWTLPEVLNTPEQVLLYLEEVEHTRKQAFGCFSSDTELFKDVALPSNEIQPLIQLLLATLVRAADYHGRAVAALKFFSAVRLPGVII